MAYPDPATSVPPGVLSCLRKAPRVLCRWEWPSGPDAPSGRGPVASTVARIFTLLLITLFFSSVIGKMVPKLGREAEWVHYNEVRDEFDRLRARLSLQLEARRGTQAPARRAS